MNNRDALAELRPKELRFLRSLSPAWRIQRFLDEIDYDVKGGGCRSPRRMIRERKAQCLDGAIFGASALRAQGHRALLLDFEAVFDDDHVIAIFRENGAWGAVGKSNYSGLRFREPIFPTIRALALSYFESYFNLRRQKTLRNFSRPVNLARFDRIHWMTTDDDLWEIGRHLEVIPHTRVLTAAQERSLGPVDPRMFAAGKVGRAE